MLVCERHEEILYDLENHENRIRDLELSDAEMKTDIKNLIKEVERLVSTINKFIFAVIGTGIGFIIWYIQTQWG